MGCVEEEGQIMESRENLAERIRRRLAEKGIEAVVSVSDSTACLDGMVGNDRLRRVAVDVVAEIDDSLIVDDRLEVIRIVSVPEAGERDVESEADRVTAALRSMDQSIVREAREEQDGMLPHADEMPLHDAGTARPYFPPTDPVVRFGAHGAEVLGGFSATSMETLVEDGEESPEDEADDERRGGRGDEQIATDVRRELAEDAATTDLTLRVHVENGVVSLRGKVPSLADAEAAEEVAARVPGVVGVDEELTILD
jgi:osmotically-inducible protein OsmY